MCLKMFWNQLVVHLLEKSVKSVLMTNIFTVLLSFSYTIARYLLENNLYRI